QKDLVEIPDQQDSLAAEVKHEHRVETHVSNTATDTDSTKTLISQCKEQETTTTTPTCVEVGTDCSNIESEQKTDEGGETQTILQDVKKEEEEEKDKEEDPLSSSGGSSDLTGLGVAASVKQEAKPPLKEVSLYDGGDSDQKFRGELSCWQLVCDTLSDWTDLASQLEADAESTAGGAGLRGRLGKTRALCNIIKNDFLPEMPMIMADKEQAREKRQREMMPRRSSYRLELKKMEDEEK
ncbi:hypothetical protein EGW08_010588, partial [Elysia chlorotica]